jgi:hypothetical protein
MGLLRLNPAGSLTTTPPGRLAFLRQPWTMGSGIEPFPAQFHAGDKK